MSKFSQAKRAASALLCVAVTACSGGGSGGSPAPAPAPSPANPVHEVTITQAAEPVESRLACYRGTATPECRLRIFQVMVESFIDGDSSADYGTGYGTSHHRGDLQGIINSLDYIQSLGVNALWLTPIFKSAAVPGQDQLADRLDATGYFTSDYFEIDPKFGTLAQAQTLVNEAHARGLYVFFDGVFGHHKSNLAPSPAGLLPVSIGNDVDWAGHQAEAMAFYREVATYWIEQLQIDGWRLDQAYQVPIASWVELRRAVSEASQRVTYRDRDGNDIHPLGYLVAELWSDEASIARDGYGTNANPALASAFDFPGRYRLVQTLATQEDTTASNAANAPARRLDEGFNTFAAYPDHAMPNLMLTNHDLVRFGDLLQRAGLANPSQDAYWARHKAAFAFMTAYSGPITLYYGDEIGQELPNYAARVSVDCVNLGLCDDHVGRTSGIVSGVSATLNARQADLKDHVARLMQLRDQHIALAAGSRAHLFSDNNIYVDRKDAGQDHVLLVLNVKPQPARIRLRAAVIDGAASLEDLLASATLLPSSGEFLIEVPALSARLLRFQ